ncbi:MAG TPA: 5-oxoprolinase subunit PxpB [Burkholderiaceae bacterium]|nr:5-oxoprolinase subunit PxpB [Burkholderiaceae bacterium]
MEPPTDPVDARFQAASDQTLLVSFGDRIAAETHDRVRSLLASLQDAPIAGTRNLHPAYCSLLIKFDPLRTTHEAIEREVRDRIGRQDTTTAAAGRQVEIPLCYGGEFGPDLAPLAELRHLSIDDLIRTHSQAAYTVYFLGFVPGFAYLGTVPDTIAAPRLSSPRRRVEAGSVGIAGRQTGIYPCAVPGGWRLIGRTPLPLFRIDRQPMALLAPGDEVRFRPICGDEFVRIKEADG